MSLECKTLSHQNTTSKQCYISVEVHIGSHLTWQAGPNPDSGLELQPQETPCFPVPDAPEAS